MAIKYAMFYEFIRKTIEIAILNNDKKKQNFVHAEALCVAKEPVQADKLPRQCRRKSTPLFRLP